MAKFIEPREEYVQVRSQRWKNIPVNVDLCTGLNRTEKHFSSDPNWYVNVAAIEFVGTCLWWAYPERDGEILRDKDYFALMDTFGEGWL